MERGNLRSVYYIRALRSDVLVHSGSSCEAFGKVCCGLWDLGDQVYHCGVHYEGVLGFLDAGYQEFDTGARMFTPPCLNN